MEDKSKSLFSIFRMPTPVNITGRSSSITNAFVNSIIPSYYPTEKQLRESLDILGLDETDLRCAYCGDKYTEWDHLRPIVRGKQPTGYISDIYNLVPACGKCNQSKGNKHWKDWISGNAQKSPKNRNIKDLQEKIARLEKYESWGKVVPIDFKEIVGRDLWESHWKNHDDLFIEMKKAQALARDIKTAIDRHLKASGPKSSR
jgi:hypothetical protein